MFYRYKGNDAVTRDDLPNGTVLMIERSTTISADALKSQLRLLFQN